MTSLLGSAAATIAAACDARPSAAPTSAASLRASRVATLKALSTVTGSLLVHLTLGSFYSVGNMIPYIVSYLRRLADSGADVKYGDTIWLFAMMNGGFGSGAIAGAAVAHRIGPLWASVAGQLIFCCGLVGSYFTVQISFICLLFTYGFLCGFGSGAAYSGPLQMSVQWHSNKTGLITGVVVCGFGGAAIVFNLIQTSNVNPDNVPASSEHANTSALDATSHQAEGPDMYFTDAQLLSRVPGTFLLLGKICACVQIAGTLLLFRPPTPVAATWTPDVAASVVTTGAGQGSSEEAIETQALLPSVGVVKKPMKPLEILRTRTFITLWIVYAFNQIVITFIVALYKAFGLTIINNDRALTVLGIAASACNASGRIVWGVVADRSSFKVALLAVCGLTVVLTATVYSTRYAPVGMYYVWVCAMFLSFSGNFVLFPAALAAEFGSECLNVTYGMLMSGSAVAGVIGGLLSSRLTSLLGIGGIFYISAVISVASVLLTLTLRGRPAASCSQQCPCCCSRE